MQVGGDGKVSHRKRKDKTMAGRLEQGNTLRFTRTLEGVCRIEKGDLATYLGNSQARILTGESQGWVVYLLTGAPAPYEVV